MPLWYQRHPEVLAEYAVDPLDVVGECRTGVSRRCNCHRAGRGAAGTGPAKHGGMTGVTPAEHDFSEIEASHSCNSWCETDKYLGAS